MKYRLLILLFLGLLKNEHAGDLNTILNNIQAIEEKLEIELKKGIFVWTLLTFGCCAAMSIVDRYEKARFKFKTAINNIQDDIVDAPKRLNENNIGRHYDASPASLENFPFGSIYRFPQNSMEGPAIWVLLEQKNPFFEQEKEPTTYEGKNDEAALALLDKNVLEIKKYCNDINDFIGRAPIIQFLFNSRSVNMPLVICSR
jgi:hypothetical protein